ncbi:hypothetical protein EV664_1097 [Stakelama pacifica]|uniref:Uncharacterized protein n=2 Tax=Stakelama pacifica TaxID=517720 RepID=A0A4R6FGX1_9SPHN|nr:hypothetical protein EV664_1097 [Stakelama pacifica]GGO97628.1 hypothetical protein GCM10011329_26950 [Stakelama pacifica]
MQYPRIDDPAHRRTPAKAGARSGFRTPAKAGVQSGAVRRSRLWIPAFAGIRVGLTAGLIAVLAACNPGSESNSTAPAPDNAAMTNDTAPATGNLDAAVQAAFGDNATYDGKNEHYVLDHHKLVQAPFGPVLVSEGTAQDAAHASAGLISAIYLKPEGSSYSVVKRYPEAIETGSFGEVGSWKIRDDLLDLPVIEAIGGGTWQGYSCQYTDLVELTADGPKTVARFQSAYSNKGAVTDDGTDISGRIADVAPGKSFTVNFTGSRSFDATYKLVNGKYVLQGGEDKQLDAC